MRGGMPLRFYLPQAATSANIVKALELHRSRVTRNHAIETSPRNIPSADTIPPNEPISNRHTPELEIELSHRKQRIGPISNRHKFTFCERVAFILSGVEGSPISASSPSSASYSSSASSASRTSCPDPKLLDFALTYRKHSTSHFLVDNFGGSLAPLPLPAPSLEPLASRCQPLATCHSPLISNRPAPRLETCVTHTKQTIGPGSNRPQNAIFNFPFFRRSPDFAVFADERSGSHWAGGGAERYSGLMGVRAQFRASSRERKTRMPDSPRFSRRISNMRARPKARSLGTMRARQDCGEKMFLRANWRISSGEMSNWVLL